MRENVVSERQEKRVFLEEEMARGRANKVSFKAFQFLKNKITGQTELRDRLGTKWSWALTSGLDFSVLFPEDD